MSFSSLTGDHNGVSFEWDRSFMWVLRRSGGDEGRRRKPDFTCDFIARIDPAATCVLKVMERKMREAANNARNSLKEGNVFLLAGNTRNSLKQ